MTSNRLGIGLGAAAAVWLLTFGPARAEPRELRVLLPPTQGLFAHGTGRRQATGPGVDAIRLWVARAGLAVRFELAVGMRGLMEAQRGPVTCATSARAEERELRYRWLGPIGRARLLLYGRGNQAQSPRSLDELAGARIGAALGSRPAALLAARGLTPELAAEEARNLSRLRAGAIDYWAANELTAQYELNAQPGAEVRPLFEFGLVEIYLACSLDTPTDWLRSLEAAVPAHTQQGGFRALGLPGR